MQELQVKVTQAQVEIIDREKFEQNINEVVAKYQNYAVTAGTIKDDKQVLADLRKLKKQLSDERIKVKKELSKPADDIDGYIKQAKKEILANESEFGFTGITLIEGIDVHEENFVDLVMQKIKEQK